MKWGVAILFIASAAFANNFVQSKNAPQKIKCSSKKDIISFEGNKSTYKLYEQSLEDVSLISCEKINIEGLPFYTVTYKSILSTKAGKKKILVYEVALAKEKLIKTVRSEVVDELEISALLPDSDFTRSLNSKWGQNSKDKSVMLMITMNDKKEKPFSYLLKLNSKKHWFENVF